MIKFPKWLIGMIVGAVLLALAACGGNEDTAQPVISPAGTTPSQQVSQPVQPAASASQRPGTSAGKPVTSASGKLTVQLMKCAPSDCVGYWLKSTGFTAGGKYYTSVQYWDVVGYRKGQNYGYLIHEGIIDENGGTPGWSWNWEDGPNGKRDAPGTYRDKMIDMTTNDFVIFDLVVPEA